MFIRNITIGTFLGLLAAAILFWFGVRPETGKCLSFDEQAADLDLGPRFDTFPAVGPTDWLRFDRFRSNYRIKGKVSSLQAYLDWRFGKRISTRDIHLDASIPGTEGGRYFLDEFTDSRRVFRLRIFESGEFVLETWPS